MNADLFRVMVRIRTVEEALLRLFAAGRLRGTVHTCLGQEATAAGVCAALDRRDIVCSNHRGHGHFLAHVGDARGLIAEIMGRPDGVCGGVGGSQHLHTPGFYSNGILGGMSAIAVGMAAAEKHLGSGRIVCAFTGDGAFGEGVLYESMNIAALWQLPIVFAVEHNQLAQSTPTELEQAGELSARARPFGIAVTEVDGNDVEAVHAAARETTAATRADHRPRLLFMGTYRLGPHSKGDDLRDRGEIERHRANDPIVRARRHVAGASTIEAEEQAAIDAILAEVDARDLIAK